MLFKPSLFLSLCLEFRFIFHPASRWCLTAAIPTEASDASEPPTVVLDPCLTSNYNQEWQAVAGRSVTVLVLRGYKLKASPWTPPLSVSFNDLSILSENYRTGSNDENIRNVSVVVHISIPDMVVGIETMQNEMLSSICKIPLVYRWTHALQ